MNRTLARRQLFSLLGTAAGGALFAQQNAGAPSNGPLQDLTRWRIEQGPETAFTFAEGEARVHPGANFPTWLRSPEEYENFDWSGEVYLSGWANGGLYFSAPRFGPPQECGYKINIFHKQDNPPLAESCGAVFPVVAPKQVTVKGRNAWNQFRIRFSYPQLQVWWNGTMVQDLDVSAHPELRDRLRQGFLGIESLSYPLRYRNFRVSKLPGKQAWETLYAKPEDMNLWTPTEKATWEPIGPVLRADGLGYLATKATYKNFRLQCYIRASLHSNGGILFRGGMDNSSFRYEIQIHDVEGAVYPTGSLYGYQRSRPYPRTQPEQWYLLQLYVKDKDCRVRINGETVVDYNNLEHLEPGHILLQAHQQNKWIEYRDIQVERI